MTGASIYVLVDALGWEILRDRPFLDDVLTDRRRLRTILGYSSGAIPTLLTGQYPDEHGHWNLFYRSPETSPFAWTKPLGWLPRTLRESRVTRRAVSAASRRLSGYSGYFTIYNLPVDRLPHFDICEHSDIYAPGGLAPARSLFDEFIDRRIPYECYNYHRHSDAAILDLVPKRLRDSEARVFFLYLCQLDAYLHYHVGDGAGVSTTLAWYEARLRAVYEAAVARWGSATLHVFSDHGMTPITGTYDLIREVESLGLRVPDDYLPAYDSTMARFWITSRRAAERIPALLSRLHCGRLVTDEERKSLRIAFADRRYGDLIFLMNSGTLICPSDMGRKPYAGMHGFHPDEPESYGVLLSSTPVPDCIRHIADVQPVILADALRRAAGATAHGAMAH